MLKSYSNSILNNIYNNNICSGENNSNWDFTGPFLNNTDLNIGIVNCVYTIDPTANRIYAGTNASGLWLTEDRGTSWKCLTDNIRIPGLGIQSIFAWNSSGIDHIVLATGITSYSSSYGIGVIKSDDGGITWNVCNFPSNALSDKLVVRKIISKPGDNSVLFAIANKSIFISTDAGNNWTLFHQLNSSNTNMFLSDIEATFINNNLKLYVSSGDDNAIGGGAEMWVFDNLANSWSRVDGLFTYIADENSNNIEYGDFEDLSSFGVGNWLISPSNNWSIGNNSGNHYANLSFATPTSINYGKIHKSNAFVGGNSYNLSFDASIPVGGSLTIKIYYVAGAPIPTNEIQQIFMIQNNTGSDMVLTNQSIDFVATKLYRHLLFEISNPNQVGSFTLDNVILSQKDLERIAISIPNPYQENIWVCYNKTPGEESVPTFVNYSEDGASSFETYRNNFITDADFNIMTFEVTSTTPNDVYIGGIHLYKIPAVGSPEFIDAIHNDIRSLFIYYNSTSVEYTTIIGNDGGCLMIEDGLKYYLNGNTPEGSHNLNITQVYGFGISEKHSGKILMGTQDNSSFLYSSGESNNWEHRWSGDGGRSIISYGNPHMLLGFNNGNLCINNQSSIGLPWSGSLWKLDQPLVQDPNDPIAYYFAGKDLFSAELSPANLIPDWTNLSNIQFTNIYPNIKQYISSLTIAPNTESQKILMSYDGPTWCYNASPAQKLYLTTDHGSNWNDITNEIEYNSGDIPVLVYAEISDILFNPYNSNEAWISINGISVDQNKTAPYNGKYRVFKRDPSTGKWNDMSNGLPCVPVNRIIYQEGTDEGLYAGTDVGVFIWNKVNQTWECFCDENMPIAIITDMEIDYCANKIYASTYGRGVWVSDLADFPANDVIIISDEIWNNERFERSNIIIQSGTLTISQNAVLKLPANKKIIVQKGAKLRIDGGIIKGYCQNPWQGIELRGDGNESQLTQGAQGQVEIINGGTIENALCGIYVGERDGNGNLLPNTGGGIVKATGAVFKNCVEAVHYTPYKNFNPNYSNHPELINTGCFTNCTFETDDDYYGMTVVLPKSFMTLNGIKGLRIKGNTFRNTADDAIPGQERGNGITSRDVTYSLQAHHCNS